MDLGLAGRVFVVSGGSRGLGLAGAQALVDEGAHVVLSARDPQAVRAAADRLGAVGVVADQADPAAAGHLVGAALEAYGRLDGALVSVGGPPTGTALGLSDEQWRGAFDSVFLGTVRLCRAVVGALPEQGGAIALVLSTSAKSPIRGLAASNGLRPGLAMLAKTMADELGSRGVRVNGVLPGRISTDRVRSLDAGRSAADLLERSRDIPLGRDGDPAEFGRVAAFLLSPAASYVTGAMVPVDGGSLRAL